MRPGSRRHSRRGLVGASTLRSTPISRSPLDKNPMPGHLSELHHVNEVNTKGQFFRTSFGKKPQVPKTARQAASLPGDISRGKRRSMPQPKTRPDSPVPSLQGPCDRSLKSEVPCGSCLNWRRGPLPIHQTQWSPERPLPPPVSLASQSHHEKPLRSPAQVEGTQGFLPQPGKALERPSSTRLEARFPYHGSGAMTRSPSPLAWRPDFPGAPREAH